MNISSSLSDPPSLGGLQGLLPHAVTTRQSLRPPNWPDGVSHHLCCYNRLNTADGLFIRVYVCFYNQPLASRDTSPPGCPLTCRAVAPLGVSFKAGLEGFHNHPAGWRVQGCRSSWMCGFDNSRVTEASPSILALVHKTQ